MGSVSGNALLSLDERTATPRRERHCSSGGPSMMMTRVVQFLHSGREHGPDHFSGEAIGWKDWNRGDHGRKFLLASGAWTRNPKRTPSEGAFTFWGEWHWLNASSRGNLLNSPSRRLSRRAKRLPDSG